MPIGGGKWVRSNRQGIGPGSWETAYRRHAPELLLFLRRRLKRHEDAEDLLQETFVRVIRAQGALRERDRIRPYLYRTAQNLLLNHFRRLRVAISEIETREMLHQGVPESGAAENPEWNLDAEELRDRLALSLERMTPPERRAFELGVLEKRPYGEIANVLGWSRSQVKVNVHRARKRVMETLSGGRTGSLDGKPE